MTKIFIDTNILIYFFEPEKGVKSNSINFIKSLNETNQIGIINSYIINEFHYTLQKLYNKKIAKKYVNQIFKIPNVEYSDTFYTPKDILKILEIATKFNLKTFDAYHAYYCKKEKIKQIATFDSDFENIPFLKIYKP